VALFFLLAGTTVAAAEKTLDEAFKDIDARTASRLIGIAGKAGRLGQLATARRIYERALELDPRNANARRMLGFKKTSLGWDRTREKEAGVNSRKDDDAARVADARFGLVRAHEWRAREIVKACIKRDAIESEKKRLLGLLRRTPRVAQVHKALGHKMHGKLWVRPELERVAKIVRVQERAWRQCAVLAANATATGRELNIPGRRADAPLYEIDGFQVSSVGFDRDPKDFANMSVGVYRFLRLVLGTDEGAWKPERLVFMTKRYYRKMIEALYRSKKDQKRKLATIGYNYRSFYALRALDFDVARDFSAHKTAYMTMSRLVEGSGDGNFAWLKEGFGYFASLELAGTAYLRMVSFKGTGDKVRYSLPAPKEKTRKNIGRWLRANIEDGLVLSLPDLCNRGINQLDLLASIQACSLVRFLALWDAKAFRRLPAAMRAAPGANDRQRTEHALRACYGMGYAELEPLWLSFTLEIDLP
jgi:hypothetical protein